MRGPARVLFRDLRAQVGIIGFRNYGLGFRDRGLGFMWGSLEEGCVFWGSKCRKSVGLRVDCLGSSCASRGKLHP